MSVGCGIPPLSIEEKISVKNEMAALLKKRHFKPSNLQPSLRNLVDRINEIPTEVLMNEFNLIKEKKSRLPRRQRDLVVLRIAYLIRNGMVTDSTTTEAPVSAQPV